MGDAGGEPRRYDTRFFLAPVPPGATVRAHAGEAIDERWVSAPVYDSMLPPTYYTLRDVVASGTIAQIVELGRDRTVHRIQPVLDSGDILLPWGDRFRMRPSPPERETR